jgi:UDP-N-acetylmuramoyl-L-alanyl-D-glutamate--2,6-diaminopimelate ligase
LAKKNDVILIAGKGHEDYQDVKGVKHHFDDRETVREIFNS